MKTIAATGHRPDKLGGYTDLVRLRLEDFAYAKVMVQRDVEGDIYVISGMALGWDQAVAKACTDLGVPWLAAIPFKGQETFWPVLAQKRYHALLEKAADIQYICDPGFSAHKMFKRNEWMVQNAEMMLALWNGTPGGTGHTVEYAKKLNRPVVNVWPSWHEAMHAGGM